MVMERLLLLGSEAAKLLAVPERTLAAWRLRGEGPPYCRIGRLIRYPYLELLRWLRFRTTRPEESVHEAMLSGPRPGRRMGPNKRLRGHRTQGGSRIPFYPPAPQN
jgi:hypothetical protein